MWSTLPHTHTYTRTHAYTAIQCLKYFLLYHLGQRWPNKCGEKNIWGQNLMKYNMTRFFLVQTFNLNENFLVLIFFFEKIVRYADAVGLNSELALRLSNLHTVAIDAIKNGVHIDLPTDLINNHLRYPHCIPLSYCCVCVCSCVCVCVWW